MYLPRQAFLTSRLRAVWIAAAMASALPAFLSIPARTQEQYQFETDLVAKRRLFESVGPGFRAIHRGPNGNYYVLTAPASALQIYDPSGKPVGPFPSESAGAVKGAALVYGESFDVDREGRVVVCDRGAPPNGAVKVYSASGALTATIPNPAPVSVVFLPAGEFAVASPHGDHLVTAYDLTGKVVREYGDREQIADRADVNAQVNFGHLVADDMGNSYFAFDYLPEPTVRKFDRVGYLATDISLKTLEFEPSASAARKAIARAQNGTPALHRIVTAVGVDPQTQEIWMAVGTLLMRFDKDGQRLASFRTYLPRGARIEASQILVEPDRLLIGADPQGIYEFSRPEK